MQRRFRDAHDRDGQQRPGREDAGIEGHRDDGRVEPRLMGGQKIERGMGRDHILSIRRDDRCRRRCPVTPTSSVPARAHRRPSARTAVVTASVVFGLTTRMRIMARRLLSMRANITKFAVQTPVQINGANVLLSRALCSNGRKNQAEIPVDLRPSRLLCEQGDARSHTNEKSMLREGVGRTATDQDIYDRVFGAILDRRLGAGRPPSGKWSLPRCSASVARR